MARLKIYDEVLDEWIYIGSGGQGDDGVGVPSGGSDGQILAKASGTDYDTEWVDAGAGSGDVVGPSSATDNAIARFDTTTGKLIQNSGITLSDNGDLNHTGSTQFNITNSGNASKAIIIGDSSAYALAVYDTETRVYAGGSNFGNMVGESGSQLITNKRMRPRVTSTTSASSITPNISTTDFVEYTALAAGLTINAPTGTPVNGEKLMFRFRDNGTSRTLTWDATYVPIGVLLPTATIPANTMYIGAIYNSGLSQWDVISMVNGAD